jgi:nitroreductase
MFVWTAVPYRTEWRYTVAAAKTILLDAGHACQALYGACEALSLGTCAQAAYDQEKLDAALGVDGRDEFAVYAAPVGRV